LWRGHFPLTIGSKTIKLPIHSFNAFLTAIVLVERPQLVPSFCFAAVAWILIAVMGWRRNSANIWGRCKSLGEMMQALLIGQSTTPPHSIKPFQDFDGAKSELEQWMKRITDAEKAAAKATLEAEMEEAERLKDLEEIGDADTDISTKVGTKITIDPIRAALYPVQLLLGDFCMYIRFVKNVFIWEECYFSFWIATASFVLAFASIFVPWFWIIKWTSRIVVWTIFGPWMKLIDIYYVSTLKPDTEEDVTRKELQERLERRLATTEAASRARQKREDAAKQKQIRKFMFGKFGMKVQCLNMDRFCDRPLPESSATPYKPKPFATLAELAMQEAGYHRTRLPGQNLVGDMIPIVSVSFL
jgi:hypothetical protein